MVHALQEIWRTLVPGGRLIDLRPHFAQFKPAVEMIVNGRPTFVGLLDEPAEDPDDVASDSAMEQGESRGLFAREREATFLFATYWDSPGEMREYIEDNWVATLPRPVYRQAVRLWAGAGEGARFRVRRNVLISRWRRLG